jgi:poly-gamma-glutamate synthesis protein (capsule biosynthesis protein)
MYFYDNKDFFPESVAEFASVTPFVIPPRVFIVNQHILAANMIARQFASMRDPSVTRVVLITQNNWNAGRAQIITSQYDWKTPLGTISSDSELTQRLIDKKIATVDESIFTHEHGITGIVPYVAHAFPNAKIVPLVIRDKTPNGAVDRLADELSTVDKAHTVVVGSIDMSHYLPTALADAHDRLTVATIQNFDYATVPRLDIDTAPTLRTIMKVAESRGDTTFIQTGGVNSSTIVGNPDLMETTSYITGYFAEENIAQRGSPKDFGALHMLFVGDMMFDRGVAEHVKKYGPDVLFAHSERLFLGNHIAVGNLEGTITDKPSVSAVDPTLLRFTFDPSTAGKLKALGLTTLSLANNHAYDFGGDGYAQTLKRLSDVGISPFGSPRNTSQLMAQNKINAHTVCVVGYHDLYTHDPTPALLEINERRPSCAAVVLFAHWGEEYHVLETTRQRTLAHQFIDGGADIVIGAHPHVVEPVEIYKNKAIFYSLGNFIFDQHLSFETEHGLALHVEWGKDNARFTLVPTTLLRDEVYIATSTDRAKILARVTSSADLPPEISSTILSAQSFTLWNNQATTSTN